MPEANNTLHDADIRQIAELMQALERSGFDSLHIETDSIKLALSKGTSTTFDASVPKAAAATKPAVSPTTITAAAPAATASSLPKQSATSTAAESGLLDVVSPIMGQFYRAPDPSSPPFVQIGAQVDETSTVGLVEVMKVFNAVAAGAKGTVAEICVDDAQTIDIGQVLFRIRPN